MYKRSRVAVSVSKTDGEWMDRCGCRSVCRRSRRHQSVSAQSVDAEYNDEDDDCSESSSVVTLLMAAGSRWSHQLAHLAGVRMSHVWRRLCRGTRKHCLSSGRVDTIVVFLKGHISWIIAISRQSGLTLNVFRSYSSLCKRDGFCIFRSTTLTGRWEENIAGDRVLTDRQRRCVGQTQQFLLSDRQKDVFYNEYLAFLNRFVCKNLFL